MNILVYTENWDGKFKKLSFELISYAAAIAKEKGGEVTALSIGNVPEDELKKLGNYGAAKVLFVNDTRFSSLDNKALSASVAKAADSVNAQLVILAHNNLGKAIAPRLAVKLEAGLVSGVTDLPSGVNPFLIRKKAFTGKAFANVQVDAERIVVTFFQNSYELVESPVDCTIEDFNPELSDDMFKTTVEETKKVTGKVLLTDAEIVVSGGRGMKGPENWGGLEELADMLSAGLACSRPVSDEGWRSHSEHVGQTGKIIAPNLYFAFGISGAIQHLGGVSSS
ncbi:MAG: electron transfer flavoprotein subunit alpha/FixB family protein, partial [bacterium]